jgi:hypothetical protein
MPKGVAIQDLYIDASSELSAMLIFHPLRRYVKRCGDYVMDLDSVALNCNPFKALR